MSLLLRWLSILMLAGALLSCSGDDSSGGGPAETSDAGRDLGPVTDAAAPVDQGREQQDLGAQEADLARDLGLQPSDAGPQPSDAATDATADLAVDAATDLAVDVGAAVPLPGFGEISGECGVLDSEELLSPDPWLLHSVIDFDDDGYDDADFGQLTDGGQEIIEDGNAGGSSIYSEVFAYEVLHRCDRAQLLKTEMEVTYIDPEGKITDLLVLMDGLEVGVSVTRAVGWPRDDPYTLEAADELLRKKLEGIQASSANVAEEDRWVKQILHVIAYAPAHAERLEEAWDAMDAATKADTVVVVTVSEGEDEFLY